MVVEKQKMVEQTLGLNLGELGGEKPGEKLSAGEVERLRSLLPEGLLPEGDLTQLEVKVYFSQTKLHKSWNLIFIRLFLMTLIILFSSQVILEAIEYIKTLQDKLEKK